MPDTVKLSHVRSTLEELTYPIEHDTAVRELEGIVVQFADGEERLADVLERSDAEAFDSVDDIEAAVYNHLPIEAVGEPGQSEGEG